MDPEGQGTTDSQDQYCPECGRPESGYFCRNCGVLLRGEDKVLCPRCHQIVPDGGFCNLCGQSLSGLALNLWQLAQAGDAFWVTSGAGDPSPHVEPLLLEPDESLVLEAGELPDWLRELPVRETPPDLAQRIYPSLSPIQETEQGAGQKGRYLVMVILLAGLVLLSLVFMTLFILLRRGG
jgi:hypothetical protein